MSQLSLQLYSDAHELLLWSVCVKCEAAVALDDDVNAGQEHEEQAAADDELELRVADRTAKRSCYSEHVCML